MAKNEDESVMALTTVRLQGWAKDPEVECRRTFALANYFQQRLDTSCRWRFLFVRTKQSSKMRFDLSAVHLLLQS